jgi:hypothetical protein
MPHPFLPLSFFQLGEKKQGREKAKESRLSEIKSRSKLESSKKGGTQECERGNT